MTYLNEKEAIRRSLCKYTKEAFDMLPLIEKPRILDIGCGSGVPTLELAGLCSGHITGLDIDQVMLERLERKICEKVLQGRVRTLKCSLLDMDFPDESFDIIWAEGSISVIGFERGLKEWRRFIKINGFLVVHDDLGDLAKKLQLATDSGYEVLDYFILNEDIWWDEYYAPLEKIITQRRAEYAGNPEILSEFKSDEVEIDMYKKDPARFRSVFFIMKKNPNGG